MMLPILDFSGPGQHYRYMAQQGCSLQSESLNHPEENDETLGEEPPPSAGSEARSPPQSLSPVSGRMADRHRLGQEPGYRPNLLPLGLPVSYSPPTTFPGCPHPTLDSRCSDVRDPISLPSCLLSSDYRSYLGSQEKSQSLSCGSLEQPHSLVSNPPCPGPYSYHPLRHPCGPLGPACCPQGPVAHHRAWPPFRLPYGPPGPNPCGCHNTDVSHSMYPPPQPRQRLTPPGAPLSIEQRKVFVTYEADNDKHVDEIIKFVALLRHNGFDMHIDVFEQQFRSISTIDFMEKYISEKDYLIIIVISPKYYETVTHGHVSMEGDERTMNTVYIHKQLQNEFIQNGSRNFRFIPILFPGAKKCHVPTWLQNTHVYSWPMNCDDILRRLMRVEKYNPPPIGELPTIISIPL
ncbi:E3 ubiquitin ligase TRAF3IP2 isoform X1 [Brienomyrus brachyistius]|uniref:E3 ubiquitin ligase TRAF3IP2 isoform X1 n=2 Tax=Brienomyrus brachyistius TaxID=42636 RepID=UPI0020B34BB7|nr:E3 ubiquitin ligase TRAF3IP2 isoform X1 [Brienomyrus brachyistius]